MGNKQQKIKTNKYIPLTVKRTYPKKLIDMNKKCDTCTNIIEPNFQLSGMIYCRDCYNKKLIINKENLIPFLELSLKAKFDANEILENKLYLGGETSAYRKEQLIELGITNILIVGLYLYQFYPNSFIYKQIEIRDEEFADILRYFIPSIIFINESKGKCLVHCKAGMSRSASIVISYIMFIQKTTFENAYNYVIERRNIIYPNEGFIEQLKEFQEMLELINYEFRFLEPMQRIIFEGNDF